MRVIGLIGGMSWESTALYYRHLNEAARAKFGGNHSAKIILWSVDFAEIAEMQHHDDWDGLAVIMIDAARKLQAAGAEAVAICTNTMHFLAEAVEDAISIPLLHIGDATALALAEQNIRRPLLLGTRFTMEAGFYADRLRAKGFAPVIPGAAARLAVHRVIYDELCQGRVLPESRRALLDEIETQRHQSAIDGVILGCTELIMLIDGGSHSLPLLDTTVLHARAAANFAFAPRSQQM